MIIILFSNNELKALICAKFSLAIHLAETSLFIIGLLAPSPDPFTRLVTHSPPFMSVKL